MDTAKAMRFAMAKAGDNVLETPVGVREVSEGTLLPDDLPEGLPDNPLLVRIEDELGNNGVAICCQQTVGAVIEASTMGTVLPVEAPERAPTRTDAALVGAFLDSFLVKFGEFAETCEERPPVEGFHTEERLDDPRAAQMVLPDATHRRYRVTLDFGLGAKVGQMILIFPNSRKEIPSAVKSAEEWSASLEKAVMGTSARIDAVICRTKVSLAEVTNWSPGDVVPLEGAALNNLMLYGASGKKVTRAKMGRAGPFRAVRVIMGADADNLSEPSALDALAISAAQDMGLAALPPAAPPPPAPLGAAEPPPLGGIDLPGDIDTGPSLGGIDLPGGDPPALGGIDLPTDAGAEPPALGGIDLPDSSDGVEPVPISLGDL
ncbi:Flagellar motor switch protein [Candidatus Rhodobacter oscarellae]|uniref:Flagellar motor switch protein n=2 Tax=Candidatus Rhodobacter oscarellae TaxID=1675527 RepID=A0A0J9E2R9_9RHOB|nr:Flagellar motor switch protein [Candidatus Rhodobacter lobularis]